MVRAQRRDRAVAAAGMKITVQITIQSDQGQADVVQQVAQLERGPLQPETLGLRGPI